MKSNKILSIALAALALAGCSSEKAHIKGVLAGAPDKEITVRQLNINVYSTIDTIKTASDGSFAYSLEVAKGQPEFVYLFYGDTRIAGLLLETGETATVAADTLGKYSVSGSEGSEKLAEADGKFADFVTKVINTDNQSDLVKLYIDYYREATRYVLGNQRSLVSVPVLYQQLSDDFPIFNTLTDALLFKNTADTLATVYPESKYVKALANEADRRMQLLELNSQIKGAAQTNFPEINLPDMSGKKVSLTETAANNKVVFLHFWDASDAAHKLVNLEMLVPIYEQYHSRGLEIYSVCLDPDKTEWAGIVRSQKLPWINVNDGLGAYCPVISLYNLRGLPATYIIADGDFADHNAINDEASLRREIDKLLRR